MTNINSLQKITPATATAKPRALEVMASRLSVDPAKMMQTLKSTCFKNASDEEMLALVVVANEYQLNPFLKEIYAFPAKGGGIVPVVSVDGWNKMLIRQDSFDGIEFEFQESSEDVSNPPVSCTATVYIKGRSKPMKITEYFDECKRNTDPWNNMPRRMLRNRTLCQAARMAFGFSGIHNDDEAATIAVDTTVEPVQPKAIKTPAAPKESAGKPQSIQAREEFQVILTENEIPFSILQKWGEETANIEGASSMATLDEVPLDTITRLIKAKAGLVSQLLALKGAQ